MIVGVYKEKGKTSREVVNEIKAIVGNKKIGHGGTLDPLAEGVLIIGIGRESTKKLHQEDFTEKEYIATIKLGQYSTTDDEEGDKFTKENTKKPSIEDINSAIKSFIGDIFQTPPVFSAVKINGKEAYKWARKGVCIKMKERLVQIKSINILSYKYPFIKIKVITGRGVYIRSLARDIGKKLNTGGYLYDLLRTKVGEFTIKDCVSIDFFRKS